MQDVYEGSCLLYVWLHNPAKISIYWNYVYRNVCAYACNIHYINQLPPERVVNTAVWYVCYFILLEMHNCVFCESLSFLRGKLTQCGNTSGRIQGTTGRVEPITVWIKKSHTKVFLVSMLSFLHTSIFLLQVFFGLANFYALIIFITGLKGKA